MVRAGLCAMESEAAEMAAVSAPMVRSGAITNVSISPLLQIVEHAEMHVMWRMPAIAV